MRDNGLSLDGQGLSPNNLNVYNTDHPLLLHSPLAKALWHKLPGPGLEFQRRETGKERWLCHGIQAGHLGTVEGGWWGCFTGSLVHEHSETGMGVCWKLRQSGNDWPTSGGEASGKVPLGHHQSPSGAAVLEPETHVAMTQEDVTGCPGRLWCRSWERGLGQSCPSSELQECCFVPIPVALLAPSLKTRIKLQHPRIR